MKFIVTRTSTLPKCLRNVSFTSYEQARSAVRKYIRSLDNGSWFGINPSISEFGFSITRT